MAKVKNCPECGCDRFDSSNDGSTVCTQCGHVVDSSNIVSEIQFSDTSGVVGTFVNARGQVGSRSSYRSMGTDSRDQSLENARRRMHIIAEQVGLRQHHVDMAQRLYALAIDHKFTKGRSVQTVSATCLYAVCRRELTPHLIIDFSEAIQVNVFILASTFLKFVAAMGLQLPLVDPALYIQRFAIGLEFEEKTTEVANTAIKLVARMKRDWMNVGRRPSGICGASLFLASKLHGFKRTIQEIIQVVKIGEDTIIKRLREFKSTPSAALNIDEFDTVPVEEDFDPPSFTRNRKLEQEEEERKQLQREQDEKFRLEWKDKNTMEDLDFDKYDSDIEKDPTDKDDIRYDKDGILIKNYVKRKQTFLNKPRVNKKTKKAALKKKKKLTKAELEDEDEDNLKEEEEDDEDEDEEVEEKQLKVEKKGTKRKQRDRVPKDKDSDEIEDDEDDNEGEEEDKENKDEKEKDEIEDEGQDQEKEGKESQIKKKVVNKKSNDSNNNNVNNKKPKKKQSEEDIINTIVKDNNLSNLRSSSNIDSIPTTLEISLKELQKKSKVEYDMSTPLPSISEPVESYPIIPSGTYISTTVDPSVFEPTATLDDLSDEELDSYIEADDAIRLAKESIWTELNKEWILKNAEREREDEEARASGRKVRKRTKKQTAASAADAMAEALRKRVKDQRIANLVHNLMGQLEPGVKDEPKSPSQTLLSAKNRFAKPQEDDDEDEEEEEDTTGGSLLHQQQQNYVNDEYYDDYY